MQVKVRIYYRWLGLGAIDVEDAAGGEVLRLGVCWRGWLSRYRFRIDGTVGQVVWRETFGSVSATATCGDRIVRIVGDKKLFGKTHYQVSDESGAVGVLRELAADRLLMRPDCAIEDVDADQAPMFAASEIRHLASRYWIVEAPQAIDLLALAALSLVLRRHGVVQSARM